MKLERASVSFPTPMLSDLKREAKERDLTLSQLIREYIRNGDGAQGRLDILREEGKESWDAAH